MRTINTTLIVVFLFIAVSTFAQTGDSLRVTSSFGSLFQFEGYQNDKAHFLGQACMSGDIKAEYGNFFAGVRANFYVGNDTPDEKVDYFLTQMKVFVGTKLGNGELRMNFGKIRRMEFGTSAFTMTGTGMGQNVSLAFGILATTPQTAMLEYSGKNYRVFGGYYETGDEYMKFRGSGYAFAGGEINLFKDKLYLSGGVDVKSGEYSGFAGVRAKVTETTSVMVEGSQLGVKNMENVVVTANQKLGKYTLVGEGHFQKDFSRALATIHTPKGIWFGAGYQNIAGASSPVVSLGINYFFGL